MAKKRKRATKVVYKTKIVQAQPQVNTSKLNEEIQELESKKAKALEGKKGFGKFLTSFAYNRSIAEKKSIVSGVSQLQKTRQQIELEKAKNELAELKQKRVNFNKPSTLKLEDLY